MEIRRREERKPFLPPEGSKEGKVMRKGYGGETSENKREEKWGVNVEG